MKSQVFEKNHRSRGGVRTRSFHLGSNAILQKRHVSVRKKEELSLIELSNQGNANDPMGKGGNAQKYSPSQYNDQNLLSQFPFQAVGHRFERELLVGLSVGATQVRHENNRLGAVIQGMFHCR